MILERVQWGVPHTPPAIVLRDRFVMRITEVRLLEGDGKPVLARVSITIDDMIVVHGLAILPGRNGGLYLAMPKHRHNDGEYRDTAHPINKETRTYIERVVFEQYKAGKAIKRERFA